jgi:pyridoxal phosphate enzyme (YggS family)
VDAAGTGIADRIAAARAAIADAAARAGRRADDVRIVAATKTMPPAIVAEALRAGLEDFGENYVQEAAEKRRAVGAGTWHFIGHLQRNKARGALAACDWIHTVDSPALVEALTRALEGGDRRVDVLVQVNVAGDPGKHGVPPEAAAGLCAAVLAAPRLRLRGLMTIGALVDAPEAARPHFRALRLLRDDVARGLGVELPHLSMGMSEDFVVAVEEGATLVRLGRVLFGARSRAPKGERA